MATKLVDIIKIARKFFGDKNGINIELPERRSKRKNEQTLLQLLRKAEASGSNNRQLPDIMNDVKERLKADGRL